MSGSIAIVDLGLCKYAEALERQLLEHQRVVDGGDPVILLVEHPPVLTLGKNADPANLLFDPAVFAAKGVEVVETDRGGEVTAHVPGQLVAYPIMTVSSLNLTPKKYVYALEEAVIAILRSYGLESNRDPEHPGVWIGLNKICAIGVRIRNRVAMHGLALNVNNEFSLFEQIVPCGIRFRGVTSIARELAVDVQMSEVKTKLSRELMSALFKS